MCPVLEGLGGTAYAALQSPLLRALYGITMKLFKGLLFSFLYLSGVGALRAEEGLECNSDYKAAIGKANRMQQNNAWEESKAQLNIAERQEACFTDVDKSSVAFLWTNYYLESNINSSDEKVVKYSLQALDLAKNNMNIDPAFPCATIIFKLKKPEILDANTQFKEICIKRLSKGASQDH